MMSSERELVKENKALAQKIKAGLSKEWKAKTVSLEEAARVGLRLVRFEQDLIAVMILHWNDGRRTILEAASGDSYGDQWNAIEENKERSIVYMRQAGMIDQKGLDYIDCVQAEIADNDKKLQKFMLERQLEDFKKKLEALDG
jgi:hypothetical protein